MEESSARRRRARNNTNDGHEAVAGSSRQSWDRSRELEQDRIIGLPVVDVRGHFTNPFYLVELCRTEQLRGPEFKITHCRLSSNDERGQYNWIQYCDTPEYYARLSTEEPPGFQSFKSTLEVVFKGLIKDQSSATWTNVRELATAPGVLRAVKEQWSGEQWRLFRSLFLGFLHGMPNGSGRCAVHNLLMLLQGFINTKMEHLFDVLNIGGGSTLSAKRSLVFYVEPHSVAMAENTKRRRRGKRSSNDGMSSEPDISATTTPTSQQYNTRAQCSSKDEISTEPAVPDVSETTATSTHQYNTCRKSSDSTDYSSLNDGSVIMSKSVRRIKKDYVPDVVLVMPPWDMIHSETVQEDYVLFTVSVKNGFAHLDDSAVNQLIHEMLPVLMKFDVAFGLIINASRAVLIKLVNVNGVIKNHRCTYNFFSHPATAKFDVEQFSTMCRDIINYCQEIYNDVF